MPSILLEFVYRPFLIILYKSVLFFFSFLIVYKEYFCITISCSCTYSFIRFWWIFRFIPFTIFVISLSLQTFRRKYIENIYILNISYYKIGAMIYIIYVTSQHFALNVKIYIYSGTFLKRTSSKAGTSLRRTRILAPQKFLRNSYNKTSPKRTF